MFPETESTQKLKIREALIMSRAKQWIQSGSCLGDFCVLFFFELLSLEITSLIGSLLFRFMP